MLQRLLCNCPDSSEPMGSLETSWSVPRLSVYSSEVDMMAFQSGHNYVYRAVSHIFKEQLGGSKSQVLPISRPAKYVLSGAHCL